MSIGLFSTGYHFSFETDKDVGRFNGEDVSNASSVCHRWTAADRPIVLAIVRAYEAQLGLPPLDFRRFQGLSGLDELVALFDVGGLSDIEHRYRFGCVVYQQLREMSSLLLVYG